MFSLYEFPALGKTGLTLCGDLDDQYGTGIKQYNVVIRNQISDCEDENILKSEVVSFSKNLDLYIVSIGLSNK